MTTKILPDRSRDRYAREILMDGRVMITRVSPDRVDATVRIAGRICTVGWTREAGWSCDCPTEHQCAHQKAVGLVVVVGGDPDVA